MKALSLADAKARFSEVVTNAEHRHERVLIEKRSKPVAVVIGYDDYKKLEAMEDLYESKLLEHSLKTGKTLTLDEVAKRLKVEL
ncbi:MAG: type II toxin-antitoxin system Phd/YefM family antitoxin [Nitrospiraceae bacterium]|nr:type II toxin-antitoxin system Phd/YefM family antitoxin [Nitrospiraceae bacterium]